MSDPIKKVTLAAGGLLWKSEMGVVRIAIVHRNWYGGDWCLPKGHQERKTDGTFETLEETARREVREETGCDTRCTDFADVIQYETDQEIKTVLFWNMEFETLKETDKGRMEKYPENGERGSDDAGNKTNEIKEVAWLTTREAIERLSYQNEKEVVRNAQRKTFGIEHDAWPGKIEVFFNRLKRRMLFKVPSERLKGSLRTFEAEIEALSRLWVRNQGMHPWWIKSVRSLFNEAYLAYEKNKFDYAWRCLHGAIRLSYYGQSAENIDNLAFEIRRDAEERLSEKRKKIVFDLLGFPENPRKGISREQLFLAATVRDEYANNQYYKLSLIRSSLFGLLLVFVILITGLIIYTRPHGFSFGDFFSLFNPHNQFNAPYRVLLGTVFFGLFGGAFSVAIPIKDQSLGAKIPEYISMANVILFRILLGAASAIALHVFIKAGLFDIFTIKGILNAQTSQSHYVMFAFSFIAGFNERFILKAIDAVAKGSK